MRDYMFGNYLRELRELSGLSQYALGRLVGVSDKAVSKWECGISKPQSSTLAKLCRALGVTVDELLSLERDASSEKAEVKMMKNEVRTTAYAKMDEIFGGKPPMWAVDRFERERAGIENTDMASEFTMLAELSKAARASGCRIANLGHTGAFYTAYLLSATDVDPLPAHYRCPGCGYSELADANCDCLDLPARTCRCGRELIRSGHGIMFESYRYVIGRPGRVGVMVPTSFMKETEKFVAEYYGGRAVKVERDGYMRRVFIILPGTHPRAGAGSITYDEYSKIRSEFPTVTVEESRTLELIRRLENETAVSADRIDLASRDLVDAFFTGGTDIIPGFGGEFMRELLRHVDKSVGGLVRAAGLAHKPVMQSSLGCGGDVQRKAEALSRMRFAYRDDVYAYLRERCGDGVAYAVMNDALHGVYAKNGMDARTRRMLVGAGVDSDAIDELSSAVYLFPRVHGVAETVRALTLLWYKLNRPSSFDDAVADIE